MDHHVCFNKKVTSVDASVRQRIIAVNTVIVTVL